MNEIAIDELCEYFIRNRADLENNYHRLASNEADGIEVYLTEECGFPYFAVEKNGVKIFMTGTSSATEAVEAYASILSDYIFPDDGSDELYEDEVRIEDINCAIEDFLLVLLGGRHPEDYDISAQDMDDIVSIVEQYLYDHFGISVYHPVEIDGVVVRFPFDGPDEDDDGQEKLPL